MQFTPLKPSHWQLHRFETLVAALVFGVCAIFLINNLLPSLNVKESLWQTPETLPVIQPVGIDFRIGLFRPGSALLAGESPYTATGINYPPFTMLIGGLFALLTEWRGYLLHYGLMVVMNAAAVWLFVRSAVKAFLPSDSMLTSGIFIAVLAVLEVASFTSYGFAFNLERGNYDIYPLFLSALFLWLLWKRPDWVWVQVLLVSMAAHLKLYPAILFVLILWKHGRKSLLPLVVVNLALALCLGPENLWLFIRRIAFDISERKTTWIGNHSAYAYASFFQYDVQSNAPSAFELIFLALPVGVWIAALLRLWRQGYSYRRGVWLFALCIPLMNLLPRVSYDYKLIWFFAPAAVILVAESWRYIQGSKTAGITLATLMVLMMMIHRSFAITPDAFASKYPYLLIVLIITLILAWTDRQS